MKLHTTEPNVVELMATPSGAPPQSKHRDGKYNWLVVTCPLTAKNKVAHSTPVAKDYKHRVGELEYTTTKLKEGGACMFHACHPHYGPGNKAKKTRYVLFFEFPLDEEATTSAHYTDAHRLQSTNEKVPLRLRLRARREQKRPLSSPSTMDISAPARWHLPSCGIGRFLNIPNQPEHRRGKPGGKRHRRAIGSYADPH